MMIDRQQPGGDALAHDGAPLALVEVGADAEHAQPLVAEARRLLARLAAQHVDEVLRAEALPRPVGGRQELLHHDRRIVGLRWLEAGVAVAAAPALRARLAEIGEQPRTPATRRLAQAQHRVELGPGDALVGVVGLGGLDEAALLDDVGQAVGHPRVGRLAVTAGAAGFLVVALEASGQVQMGDEAHVGLVDSHAEGDRRDDHHAVLAGEALLVRGAPLGVHPGVVGERGDAVAGEQLGGGLDLRARQAVDDAGLTLVAAQELEQLAPRIGLLDDPVADVRPVEARHEDARALEAELRDDLGARLRVGGGGQCDARHVRKALVQHGELRVFRAEVMAPLRHAVRLVDRVERDRARGEQREAALGEQALGRDIEQVELAASHGRLDARRAGRAQRRVEVRRAHAVGEQRVDLVLHQGDQRRHHDADALAKQRWHLVADRLAATGGHEDQRVAAAGDVSDDLGLLAAEVGVPERAREHLARARVEQCRAPRCWRGGKWRDGKRGIHGGIMRSRGDRTGRHPRRTA